MSKYLTAEQMNNAVALCKDEPFTKASVIAITELLPAADVVEVGLLVNDFTERYKAWEEAAKIDNNLEYKGMARAYKNACDIIKSISTNGARSSSVYTYRGYAGDGYYLEETGDWDDVIAGRKTRK